MGIKQNLLHGDARNETLENRSIIYPLDMKQLYHAHNVYTNVLFGTILLIPLHGLTWSKLRIYILLHHSYWEYYSDYKNIRNIPSLQP